jgi:hypothetical protein
LITIFAKILAVVSPFSAVIYYVSAPEMGNYKPRRFKAGLANFHERYSKVVDSWAFYDSSGMHPKLIDWSKK